MVYSHVISSYIKVFKNETPVFDPACLNLTALKGDTVSFQVVYYSKENVSGKIKIESPFGRHLLARTVEYVKVTRTCASEDLMLKDGNHIKMEPFDAPDILRSLRGGKIKITKNKYRTLRVDIDVPAKFKAGDYTVKVILEGENGEVLAENAQDIKIYDATLPKAKLIHTEWFHTDCIADYYGYEVFSEKHWSAIENFMKAATKRGINMILTPVVTPPLDTAVGGERTTVQLVDITKNGDAWSFGFDKFDRWVALAQKCGYEYFEICHLFTQWGANAAPKVMATVDGKYKRVFGWDTLVEDGAYPAFLNIFLPALTAHLRELGIAEKCWFHVSDEPGMDHFNNYMRAKNIIKPHLEGFKLMDALSKPDFYDTGACEHPIPSINHIMPFIERKIPDLWSYYCVSQSLKTSNRYMTMSLTRTRAIGVQWFKYGIAGFLHWGFNFYNTIHSKRHISPYKPIPAEETFPGGDGWMVYPGAGGKVEESIRWMAFYAAQTDLRALQALAEKTSYEHVMELIEGDLAKPITFEEYPTSEYYYVTLRNRVNKELAEK